MLRTFSSTCFFFLIPFANICLSLDILKTETFLRVPYVTKRKVVILGTPYACDNICLGKKKLKPFYLKSSEALEKEEPSVVFQAVYFVISIVVRVRYCTQTVL